MDSFLEQKVSPYLLDETRDWESVRTFCRDTYSAREIVPLVRNSKPDAVLKRLKNNDVTFSRFRFGVPTRAENYDRAAGNIIVVNTLQGSVRHPLTDRTHVETKAGESYVVDGSRADYWHVASGDDLQLNLTIPHQLMEDISERWFGFIPDDSLWKKRVVFGGADSVWFASLNYAVKSASDHSRCGHVIAKKIEELLCVELLHNWASGVGLRLEDGARAAAPRYVREAEKLMAEQADQNPALSDIAVQVGTSVRSLSAGFRKFRGITPYSYLKVQRLEKLNKALYEARPGETVASIAKSLGYINLGAMTADYRTRFGVNPTQVLRTSRRTGL